MVYGGLYTDFGIFFSLIAVAVLFGLPATGHSEKYNCLSINLDEYEGNFLFIDHILKGVIISERDYAVPSDANIEVCKSISEFTGKCLDRVAEFKLRGQGERC